MKPKDAFETIGLRAAYSIGLLDSRNVLIRFNHEEDYHWVWIREVWYLKKFPMRLFKWSPNFCADAESSVAPVWVNFLAIIFRARTVGSSLYAATEVLTRPSVARVFVEMDLLQKIPNRDCYWRFLATS